MSATELTYAETAVVAATPQQVYDLVSDVTRTGEWSPICRECWWDEGDGPRVGAWFTGRNEVPGRTWQTRPRPELDRVASAWLIRRFIDEAAVFVFAAERTADRVTVTFDMVDADFGHEGDDCTFETLMRRFSLKAPGLPEVAEIVHAADFEDGKFPRTEGSGLLCVLRGWARQGLADEEILRRGLDLMDGLHLSLTAP